MRIYRILTLRLGSVGKSLGAWCGNGTACIDTDRAGQESGAQTLQKLAGKGQAGQG